MLEYFLNKYKKSLDEIKNDKEELEKELRKVRSCYNAYHNFSSGFLVPFFLGFVGYIFKFSEIPDITLRFVCVGVIFLIILIYQMLFVGISNVCYEEMKLVEKELEKINSTIQPNPKKISIRIRNCNLVRRSVFGR